MGTIHAQSLHTQPYATWVLHTPPSPSPCMQHPNRSNTLHLLTPPTTYYFHHYHSSNIHFLSYESHLQPTHQSFNNFTSLSFILHSIHIHCYQLHALSSHPRTHYHTHLQQRKQKRQLERKHRKAL